MNSVEQSLELPQRPIGRLPIPEKYEGKGVKKSSVERSLTARQEKFINYYLAGKTPPEAARIAGYSESVAATASVTLLRNPAIYQEINQRARDKFKELEIDAEWILGQLGNVATANILDYGDIDENGRFVTNLKKIDRNQAGAILELKYDLQGNPIVKLKDSNTALEKIIRLLGYDKAPLGSGKDVEDQPLTINTLDMIVNKVTVHQTINQQINIQERQQLPEAKIVDASV